VTQHPAAPDRSIATSGTAVQIDRVEVRLVRLPLVEPFETSFGRIDSRLVFLVRVEAAGASGWGEVVALEEPTYSYETVATALEVMRRHLVPALMTGPIIELDEVAGRFGRFRGHHMARAGLELACADLLAGLRSEPLARFLGGSRSRVPVGVSLGIQPTLAALLDRVDQHLALGYQRIKLKIKPGWDLDVVAAVRGRHPDILLSVDANAAYTIEDLEHLRRLDGFELLMIEQPLAHDDLLDHARLQASLRTPLCLDESVTSVRLARQALELGSCRVINIKVGRVGGYTQALAIHDLCRARGVAVWCGGMLESGVGRAHNVALASLPGFTLPGDISASSRYFRRDLIVPEIQVRLDGTVEVPQSAGLGFDLDLDYITSRTETMETIERRHADG